MSRVTTLCTQLGILRAADFLRCPSPSAFIHLYATTASTARGKPAAGAVEAYDWMHEQELVDLVKVTASRMLGVDEEA